LAKVLINGTEDKVQVFRNGNLVSSTTNSWNPNGTNLYDIILGWSPDGGGYNKFITDNIVVYDYAKTDFSDRFKENPAGKTFAAFNATADTTYGPKPNDNSLKLNGNFTLATDSNGIDPVGEAVTVSLGSYSISIPSGSFQMDGTSYKYVDAAKHLNVAIRPSSGSGTSYQNDFHADFANVYGITPPPSAQLTIGDDYGSTKLDTGSAHYGKGSGGDLSGNGVVDCPDLAIVREAYGKKAGQAGFNPLADVNGDKVVDVRDLSFVSRQMPAGTTCP